MLSSMLASDVIGCCFPSVALAFAFCPWASLVPGMSEFGVLQVMAHSSQGGTIRASEAAEALEFVAGTVEERDIWVTGINMVLHDVVKFACVRTCASLFHMRPNCAV